MLLLAQYQILYLSDFIALPFFILFWVVLIYAVKVIKYKDEEFSKYIIPAFLLRIVGSILTALMYQYYYGYGDTFYYFIGASDIFNQAFSNPAISLEMLSVPFENWSLETKKAYTYSFFFSSPTESVVLRYGGLFGIFPGFGSYMGISLCFTSVSFLGTWLIYRVFTKIYPHLHKPLAYAVLFLPSMCFWSTGIMKDPLVMGGLGMLFYGLYHLLVKRGSSILLCLAFIYIGFQLTFHIKKYTFMAFAPTFGFMLIYNFILLVKNPTIRRVLVPFFLILSGLGFFGFVNFLSNYYAAFSLEGFIDEASKMQWWLQYSTERDDGTGYSLGEYDPSFTGVLQLIPKSINVTLFRPYIWEARKIIVIPSAIEAFITLLLTFYVIVIKVGVIRSLRISLGNPFVLFCLLFSLLFAFAVGFTSYNFGALARYKLPCLPFYLSAILFIYHHGQSAKISKEKPSSLAH